MSFKYLDKESENLLKDLLINSNIQGKIMSGTAIDLLVKQGYVEGKECTTLSNNKPEYVLIGINQNGKSYFEFKKQFEKEQKKLSRREWKIAIISAVIGSLVSLSPKIISIIVNLFS